MTEHFLIIAPTRSGSCMLVKLLDSHSQLNCEFEKFKRYSKVVSTKKNLHKWFANRFACNYSYGFKLLYEHHERPLKRGIPSWSVYEDFSLKLIHLHRKSLLKQFISFYLAIQKNEWGEKVYSVDLPIKIPITEKDGLAGKLQQWTRLEKEIQTGLNSYAHPYLELWYEDLVEQLIPTSTRIWDFLNVKHEEIELQTIKQFVWNYEEVILNYNETKEWMQENGFGDRV